MCALTSSSSSRAPCVPNCSPSPADSSTAPVSQPCACPPPGHGAPRSPEHCSPCVLSTPPPDSRSTGGPAPRTPDTERRQPEPLHHADLATPHHKPPPARQL